MRENLENKSDDFELFLNPDVLEKFHVQVVAVRIRCVVCKHSFRKYLQTREEYLEFIHHTTLPAEQLICRKCAQKEHLRKIINGR
jgi:hypothetical protein